MDLLQEIVDANRKAEARNKEYRGPLKGFAGKGSGEVWAQMSLEAQKKWDEQRWPRELLISPEHLTEWAGRFGLDITDM